MTAAMDRARRSPLRFLAPLGLAAFAIAFLLVIATAGDSGGGDSGNADDAAEQRDLKGGGGGDRRERRREDREERLPDDVYIVKEGDTLASISQKTGISVEELQELNPQLDPQALVTVQRVRLRE